MREARANEEPGGNWQPRGPLERIGRLGIVLILNKNLNGPLRHNMIVYKCLHLKVVFKTA